MEVDVIVPPDPQIVYQKYACWQVRVRPAPVVPVMTVVPPRAGWISWVRFAISSRVAEPRFRLRASWLAAFRLLTYRPAYLEAGCSRFPSRRPSLIDRHQRRGRAGFALGELVLNGQLRALASSTVRKSAMPLL